MVGIVLNKETRPRKRAYKPKVKTGCLTCRKRRIKCDEQRPICKKCVTGRFDCDGYVTPNQSTDPIVISETDGSKRALLPKLSTTSVQQRAALMKINGGVQNIVQPSVSFLTEQEHRYIEIFRESLCSELWGYHDFSLWNCLILQASEQEPSIRHAIVAIGALERTRRAKHLATAPGLEGTVTEMDEHHVFAVKQYSKAIYKMRNAISNRVHSIRTTLLTCLLIVYFETLHGNHISAISQMQAGLRLLEDWISKQRYTSPQIPWVKEDSPASEVSTSGEENYSSFGIYSPSPKIIDDEIIHAFGRLDAQAISFHDVRPIEYHRMMKNCGSLQVAQMPLTFVDLREARIYLELHIRRLMHWISSASDIRNDAKPQEDADNEKDGLVKAGGIFHSCRYSTYVLDIGLREQKERLDEMDLWHERFKPLYENVQQTPQSCEFYAATFMQINWLATRMALANSLSNSQLTFDNFKPTFMEILNLVGIIFARPELLPTFSFDIHLIPILFFVSLKCRDPRIRKQAIGLLLKHPRREGVWDSIVAGKMACAAVELEEKHMDPRTGFIPSWARVAGTRMLFDLIDRHGTMIAFVVRDGKGVEVVKKEIRW